MGKRILTWFTAGILFLVILGIAIIPLEEPAQRSLPAAVPISVPVSAEKEGPAAIPAAPAVQQTVTVNPPVQQNEVVTIPVESSDLAAAFAHTPPPEAVKVKPAETAGEGYLLNTNTGKFHVPTCFSITLMNDEHKLPFSGNRDELIAKGYAPCMNCNP